MGFFDFIGGAASAVGGAASSVGSYLTQPASAPGQTTDEYAMPQPMAQPAQLAAPVEPVIPANQSIVTGSADESGEYRPVSMDTTQPSQQSFVEHYVEPTQEITRADYTPMAKLGDEHTQDLIKKGYSPEQALSTQIDIERAEGDTRAARYYQNELDKALESKIGLSSEYHAAAQESGLPQGPNPFEYVGDLSKQLLYKSAGVSNVPGTGLQPQYQGSFAKDVNILTKAARTGEMGDYGSLGKPYSSGLGILSLETQQDIGRTAAATARAKGIGWDVDEHAMDRFTPELKKSAGFNLFYTPIPEEGSESTFGLAPFKSSGAAVKGDKTINIELESGDVIQRKASDYEVGSQFGILGGLLNKEATPRPTLTGEIKSPGITRETINQYLLPEDMVDTGKSSMKVEVPGLTGGKSVAGGSSVSENIDNKISDVTGTRKVEMVYAPESNWLNRYTGGMTGGDESIGGFKLYKSQGGFLEPLRTPKGSAMDTGTLFGRTRMRRSEYSFPFMKRKSTHKDIAPVKMVSEKKSDPSLNLHLDTVINDNIMPKSLGADLFKFNVESPNKKLVKSINTTAIVKIKSGKKSKSLSIPDIGVMDKENKSGIENHINSIVKTIANPSKGNKIKKMIGR